MDVIQTETSVRACSGVPQSLTVLREFLSELGRATTAYYEATPDRLEQARQEYQEALRQFNGAAESPQV